MPAALQAIQEGAEAAGAAAGPPLGGALLPFTQWCVGDG